MQFAHNLVLLYYIIFGYITKFYYCPSDSEITLRDIGKVGIWPQ